MTLTKPPHRRQDYPGHRCALRLSNSSTLKLFNSCTIRPHFRRSCLFLPNVFYLSRPGVVFQSAWERGRSVRDPQSRVTSHESPVTVHRFHGQRRQRCKSSRNATTRLPGADSLQYRPQSDRAELSLARPVQRLSRLGDVSAHAHPSGVARRAPSVFVRVLSGTLRCSHHIPRFAHGLSCVDRRAAGRLRQLFPAAANRRAGDGFSQIESALLLGYRRLAPRSDHHVLGRPGNGNHPLDRQRRALLPRLSLQRHQFQRYHHRPARPWHDLAAAPAHRLGLVHQRNSEHIDFQHSSCSVRLLVIGSPFEHPLFSVFEFSCRSAGKFCREFSSGALAAALLVFRPSRSLYRNASVLRTRHPSPLHVFPQARLDGTPRGSGIVRRGRLWLLRLGPAHVCQRHEPVFPPGLFAPGFLARSARRDSADQLAGHALERAPSAQHLDVVRHRFRFALPGGRNFWNFPRGTRLGRRLNESLGKIHFWLTFAGVYLVFMPMHWLGLLTHANLYSGSRLAAISAMVAPVRAFITVAAILLVLAQGIFLFNFLWSLFHGEKVEERNPWRATTLEWSVSSPPPAGDFGPTGPVVYRGAYEFSVPGVAEDFVPQHLSPEEVAKAR